MKTFETRRLDQLDGSIACKRDSYRAKPCLCLSLSTSSIAQNESSAVVARSSFDLHIECAVMMNICQWTITTLLWLIPDMLDCPLYCCAILYNKCLVVSVLSGLVVLHLSTASRTAPVQLIYCTTHLVHVQSLALIRHREIEHAQDPFPGNITEETIRQPVELSMVT